MTTQSGKVNKILAWEAIGHVFESRVKPFLFSQLENTLSSNLNFMTFYGRLTDF